MNVMGYDGTTNFYPDVPQSFSSPNKIHFWLYSSAATHAFLISQTLHVSLYWVIPCQITKVDQVTPSDFDETQSKYFFAYIMVTLNFFFFSPLVQVI